MQGVYDGLGLQTGMVHGGNYCESLTGKGIQTNQTYMMEKEMETHSSILAWEIPWTEEPSPATVHRVTKSQT